jgi:ethanolamine utilization protein EutN
VRGQVVATRKDDSLVGIRLLLIEPLGQDQVPTGTLVVAADGLQSQDGELVVCVRAREASLAVPGRQLPSDCSIVAKVDAVGA